MLKSKQAAPGCPAPPQGGTELLWKRLPNSLHLLNEAMAVYTYMHEVHLLIVLGRSRYDCTEWNS